MLIECSWQSENLTFQKIYRPRRSGKYDVTFFVSSGDFSIYSPPSRLHGIAKLTDIYMHKYDGLSTGFKRQLWLMTEKGWLSVQETMPWRESSLPSSPTHIAALPSVHTRVLTMSRPTGETIPLHAGAHSPRPSRILHPEAARHERVFRADDHLAAPRAPHPRPQPCQPRPPHTTAL